MTDTNTTEEAAEFDRLAKLAIGVGKPTQVEREAALSRFVELAKAKGWAVRPVKDSRRFYLSRPDEESLMDLGGQPDETRAWWSAAWHWRFRDAVLEETIDAE